MITKSYDVVVKIGREDIVATAINLVQNDYDVYSLNIRVFDGNSEIDYSQVTSATATFSLSNGAVVQSDPDRLVKAVSGITYEVGTDEIACPGNVIASVQLFGAAGERLTTARFQFTVTKDLITPGSVQSDSNYPILQQLKFELEAINVVALTNDYNSHKVDLITDLDGAHGLKIETGTFTPALSIGGSSAGITYAQQLGVYYKIDKLVYFRIELELTNKGSLTGSLQITGLPFASSPNRPYNATHLGELNGVGGVYGNYSAFIGVNASSLILRGTNDSGIRSDLSNSNITNTSRIITNGTYMTN